jgi:FkbM family methyltransferase
MDSIYKMSVETSITQQLTDLHSKLKLNYGNFSEEYPEQEMAVMYIKPDDIVLEIGGNIGRNSCIIGSLLNDSKNLVVFESFNTYAQQLKENRDLNNLSFHIEDCAISKCDLYQKHWDTKPVDEMYSRDFIERTKVKTSTWSDIKDKYDNLLFNTLVADCEGALYYILRDEPTFLENFKKIIIENDFKDLNHKLSVDEEFKKFNFKRVYVKAIDSCPSMFDNVKEFFFEVWEKELN